MKQVLVAIAILVIILCVILSIRYQYPKIIKIDGSIYKLSDIINQFKTGDLLLFSCRGTSQCFIKAWTSSCFTHTAMVLKFNGELYLWECDIGQGLKSGARVIKLKDKLNKYDYEQKICSYVPIKDALPTNDLLSYINDNIKLDIDNIMISHLLPFVQKKGEVYCSQLLAKTYRHFGLDKINEHT